MGLEPTSIAAFDFESNMSTNSITLAESETIFVALQNICI